MFEKNSGQKAIKEIEEGVEDFKKEKENIENDQVITLAEMEMEITPEVSAKNIETGILKIKEIISATKGEFIGIYKKEIGEDEIGIKTLSYMGENALIAELKGDKKELWAPLFDDQLFQIRALNETETTFYYIGENKIASESFLRDENGNGYYIVVGEEVNRSDFQKFKEELQKLAQENLQQKGIQNATERTYPDKFKEKID